MLGKLFVIGVGPGDPELITLKAVRILKDISCIFVPKGKEEGSSIALSIVEKVIDLKDKEIIEAYFPMKKTRLQAFDSCELDTKWHETIETIYSKLNKGIDVAFITLGDPTIYSTFFYLYDKLLELSPLLNIEIIPGVSSINAGAARAKLSLSLADEKIAILPATYVDDIEEILQKFDTIILMKVHRVFNKVLDMLYVTNLTDKAIYISKAGMEDEKILKNIKEVKKDDLNYFSLVIVKK